jgi:hypothetical protein
MSDLIDLPTSEAEPNILPRIKAIVLNMETTAIKFTQAASTSNCSLAQLQIRKFCRAIATSGTKVGRHSMRLRREQNKMELQF